MLPERQVYTMWLLEGTANPQSTADGDGLLLSPAPDKALLALPPQSVFVEVQPSGPAAGLTHTFPCGFSVLRLLYSRSA